MLAIRGPRGSGKTTLVLQYIKYGLNQNPETVLYLTADHHWFYNHQLYETAEEFYLNGGRHLFIDEVHKYEGWSHELKNIYDGFPDLKIVFNASSALDIYRGEADLSRRVITYNLPGMSFREYLRLTQSIDFSTTELKQLYTSHREIAHQVLGQIQPIPHFKEYLKYGYLPIITESSKKDLPIRLNQIINTVIESDLTHIEGFDSGTARKIKKMLGVIAESAPFKPNISSLARKLDASRDSVYAWLEYLQNAKLLNAIHQQGKGVSTLQKPDKIYLENTNLAYALKENPDIGSIREAFLLNQFLNAGYKVYLPKSGDFFIDNFIIEAGGKNKTAKQVNHLDNYLVAADDIEIGFRKKVPLWLFGFLY